MSILISMLGCLGEGRWEVWGDRGWCLAGEVG